MINMSILFADHQYFESVTHHLGLKRNHPYMKSEMNCKRLQVGQFWSARPRGHNRWLHQVRPNYSCISCHATFRHFHYISVGNIHVRYFRQLLRGFVLPIPLFRVVSPRGGGSAEDFAVSHPPRGETIYCACKTSEHVSACT